MRRDETEKDDKRMTLRMPQELWRRLRVEAGHRDVSTTLLINRLLEEGLTGAERQRRGGA